MADAAAVSRAVRLARGFADRRGLDAVAANHLAVVVEEWIANVVEHGGPQGGARIVLRLSLEGGLVRVAVSDAGRPFDPRNAAFDQPNAERGGGAGLAMIASLSRIATYVRRAGRNRLVLEMPLAYAASALATGARKAVRTIARTMLATAVSIASIRRPPFRPCWAKAAPSIICI